MPEFTYEESDNYLLAQMASGYSDGRLKREYFNCLKIIKESRGGNRADHMWLDILKTNLELRGLIVNGKIVNKKVSDKS